MSKLLKPRTIGFLLILVLLAALTFGFAASNTVTDSKAGYGASTVSGYNVTVSWTLNIGNPINVTQATLNFGGDTPSQAWASIEIDATSPYCDGDEAWGSWIDCGSGAPYNCTYAGPVEGICGIRVSAGD